MKIRFIELKIGENGIEILNEEVQDTESSPKYLEFFPEKMTRLAIFRMFMSFEGMNKCKCGKPDCGLMARSAGLLKDEYQIALKSILDLFEGVSPEELVKLEESIISAAEEEMKRAVQSILERMYENTAQVLKKGPAH